MRGMLASTGTPVKARTSSALWNDVSSRPASIAAAAPAAHGAGAADNSRRRRLGGGGGRGLALEPRDLGLQPDDVRISVAEPVLQLGQVILELLQPAALGRGRGRRHRLGLELGQPAEEVVSAIEGPHALVAGRAQLRVE